MESRDDRVAMTEGGTLGRDTVDPKKSGKKDKALRKGQLAGDDGRALGKSKGKGKGKGKDKEKGKGKGKLKRKDYDRALKKLQVELVKLQQWVVHKGLKIC